MTFLAEVVLYLVVGLLLGAITSRVIYRADSRTKGTAARIVELQRQLPDLEAALAAARKAHYAPRSKQADETAYYAANETLVNVQNQIPRLTANMKVAQDQAFGWGLAVVAFWPVAIVLGVLVLAVWGLWKVGSKMLVTVLTPGAAIDDAQVIKGTLK